MIKFRYFSLFIALIAVWDLVAAPKSITIKTQQQFDDAIRRINNGEEARINLANKRYILKTNIIAKSPLVINGRGATINAFTDSYTSLEAVREIGDFYVCKQKSTFSPFSLFYDDSGKKIRVSESVEDSIGVNLADNGLPAESRFSAGTVIRIPISGNLYHLKNRTFENAFGYFDCGWQTVEFLLEKADENYFYCKTKNYCRTRNYSYDYSAYKKAVRYVIYNAERKTGQIFYDGTYVFIPKSIKRVYRVNYKYGLQSPSISASSDFTMANVHIVGFNGIAIDSDASKVCEIKNCKFNYCVGPALYIKRTAAEKVREAIINRCTFSECSLLEGYMVNLIGPFEGANYISMSDCIMSRYPNGCVIYKNPDGCIHADGNVRLIGNTIYNTPRCHLYFDRGRIVAKGNYLYNTDSFNIFVYRNRSCDLGLVYCNHLFSKTDDALRNIKHKIFLEGNLLYGAYSYVHDARGIFIDDGRGDVECYDNIILNSQRYSIDSRNISMHDASSVRNIYSGNIVTTKYRLEAGSAVEGYNTSVLMKNYIANIERSTLRNVAIKEEDVMIGDVLYSIKDGSIFVSTALYERIKKTSCWRLIRSHVHQKEP